MTRRTFLGGLLLVGCSEAAALVPAGDPGALATGAADSAPTATTTPDDAASPAPPATYTNPVHDGDFPDPFVLHDGARWLAFGTNGDGANVRVLASTDRATWSALPDALPVLPSWARANASLTWAPAVLRRGAGFVLYYTARDTAAGFQCIGRATSADAAGPYVDDTTAPFVCQVEPPAALCGSIDPSPFVDENGDAYLTWKSDENADACRSDARLWSQRLGVDGLSLLGTPTALLARDQTWERPLIEGPSMLKYGARYHLFYSAGWWESSGYGIGHAVCATPLGPCTKTTLDGPLAGSTGDVLGPGGQEVFLDEHGAPWLAYHAWTAPVVGYANGGARSLRVDPLTFDAAGTPSLTLTTTARPR